MKRTTLRAVGLLLGLGLFTLTGCDSQKKKGQSDATESTSTTAPKATAPKPKETELPAQPSREARPSQTQEEVRGFVATWLKAQNAGNFEAYSALYASRFTGVKRAGGRTFHFNRAEWIKDRHGDCSC